jgi:Helix-turn-helix domain
MPNDDEAQSLPATDNTQGVYEPRELTDPTTLRALTHPVRLALLEALTLEGPLTATAAGELIGESPTTCSFHFRQLAKYGFVEEAGAVPGRQRPWKLAHVGLRFSEEHDDPEMAIAARSLERMVMDRAFARLQHFIDTRASYPKEWRESSTASESILYVSLDELHAIEEEFMALMTRFHDRLSDASLRPADSLPVEVLLFAHPLRLPKEAP